MAGKKRKRTKIPHASDVEAELRAEEEAARNDPWQQGNWRARLPKGSLWHSQSPGDPYCPICMGLGFIKFDLPIDHRYFGKLCYCYCVSPDNGQVEKQRQEDEDED
jgi:hypothetical protein